MVARTSAASYTAGGGTREQAVADCEEEASSPEAAALATATLDDVHVVEEGADAATVSAAATVDGATETQEFPLVFEDGLWKIDFYNMGAGASAETGSANP